MEKRAGTGETNLLNLIKQADAEEAVVDLSFDGFLKYGSGRNKPCVVIIATGDRATKLCSLLKDMLE